jgi:outer membrane lipoprotein carrier protein
MKKLLIIITLLLSSNFAQAQEPIKELKKFLSNSQTLTSKFKQVLFDKDNKIKQTSEGLFTLSRPGKFRWSYQKPFIQEIVSNSGKVWFYDADLEQVTIKKLDKSMGSTPASLLSGEIDIEKEFKLEDQGEEEGLSWIKLVPKNEETSFKYILIGLDKGVLGGMELSDNFGQLTRIYFSEVKINPQIDDKEFVFIIPEGADVFED